MKNFNKTLINVIFVVTLVIIFILEAITPTVKAQVITMEEIEAQIKAIQNQITQLRVKLNSIDIPLEPSSLPIPLPVPLPEPCYSAGEKQCVGDLIQECIWWKGNLIWSDLESCADFLGIKPDQIVCGFQCPLLKVPEFYCNPNLLLPGCDIGCVENINCYCQDECETEGMEQCEDDETFKTCRRDHDIDVCLEWKWEMCPENTQCNDDPFNPPTGCVSITPTPIPIPESISESTPTSSPTSYKENLNDIANKLASISNVVAEIIEKTKELIKK